MLQRFGFTPTEDRVYKTLLQLGSVTGYAVARELGIARANVYQALESLARRGAARKAATIPVQYAATGPSALVAELERGFRKDLAHLEDELHSLPIRPGAAAELELVTSRDQLMTRALACINGATTEILGVTGPWAEAVNARLEHAATRNVGVRVVSLGGPERPVADAELTGYWGGQPLAVVADRGRAVMGVLSGGDAANGIATSAAGVIPFIRHLLRRELSGGS